MDSVSINQAVLDISEKYSVSKNIINAMMRLGFADYLPPDIIREKNETKMDAVLSIAKECEFFTQYGNGKPAERVLPNAHEGKPADLPYCDYVIISKEPIPYETGVKQHLSNCLMVCSSKRGTNYYHIKNHIKENKTGIYYLDTVCGCSKASCSFPKHFDISGISSISEEKFQKMLLSGTIHNPEKIYTIVKTDIVQKMFDGVLKHEDLIETDAITPGKNTSDEDLRYIG